MKIINLGRFDLNELLFFEIIKELSIGSFK